MLGAGLAKDYASWLLYIAPSASWIYLFLTCWLMKYLNRNENGLERDRIYNTQKPVLIVLKTAWERNANGQDWLWTGLNGHIVVKTVQKRSRMGWNLLEAGLSGNRMDWNVLRMTANDIKVTYFRSKRCESAVQTRCTAIVMHLLQTVLCRSKSQNWTFRPVLILFHEIFRTGRNVLRTDSV